MSKKTTKCGFVGILGLPNAGKSTLINQLVGYKVSIVSPRVQTTRRRVLGIVVKDETQIIFIDTPGIFKPSDKAMDKAMAEQAWGALAQADVFVWVVDSIMPKLPAIEGFIRRLPRDKPCIILFNKIDRIAKEKLLPLAKTALEMRPDAQIMMASALANDGVDALVSQLKQYLPASPWLYPEDQMTDLPQRLWAAEITREQLYYHLRHELPYQMYVETEAWEDFDNGSVKISQAIIVAKEGQKQIIIGHKGGMLSTIGRHARQEMKRHLEREVHLKLFVKVREDWYDKPWVGQVM